MIKGRAKAALRSRYWLLVGTLFVAALLDGSSAAGVISNSRGAAEEFAPGIWETVRNYVLAFFDGNTHGTVTVTPNTRVTIIAIAAAAILFKVFVSNPVAVGARRVSLEAYRGEPFLFGELFFAFKNGDYSRIVTAMFLRELILLVPAVVMLAAALFVESALVKYTVFAAGMVIVLVLSLGLGQVESLLADDRVSRGISSQGVLSGSWELMRGRKLELFIFGLSFIGWQMLSAITGGIVGVFWYAPYEEIALAGWYSECANVEAV